MPRTSIHVKAVMVKRYVITDATGNHQYGPEFLTEEEANKHLDSVNKFVEEKMREIGWTQ